MFIRSSKTECVSVENMCVMIFMYFGVNLIVGIFHALLFHRTHGKVS